MDWPNRVFPITGPPNNAKKFGTGFVVAANTRGLWLVTCWHVVKDIGTDCLHLNWRWPCELVSKPGDDDLDLAVLRVPNPTLQSTSRTVHQPDALAFPMPEPFAVAATGFRYQCFETFGYEPVGRPLSGELGANTYRPHASHDSVPAWDYYLKDEGRDLEKIKDGYSGAPVYDSESNAVVAVITHRQGTNKGFAIDIGNLPRVYSEAAAWLRQPNSVADSDHEYLIDEDALALAIRLDHQDQCESVEELLKRPGSDPAIAFVECGPKDWPLDLAHHIQTEHALRNEQALFTQAIDLRLRVFADTAAFWDELVRTTPSASNSPDPRAVVRGYLSARRVAVLYTSVNLNRSGWHLPKIVRGANDVLRQLGDLADTQVLVLIAGYRTWRRPPPWWRWWVVPRIKRLGYCHSLPAMRRLESTDLDEWCSGLPASLRSRYKPERLKSELLRLFPDDEDRISHDEARNLLTGWPDGQSVLVRARC
jgi:hypothetical protein